MEETKEIFYAHEIVDPEFTEQELILMKIQFFDNLEDIEQAAINLGVENFDKEVDLLEGYGLVLSKIGSLSDSTWALYSAEKRFDYVSDVWNRKNFYIISLKTETGVKKIFNKAHLRQHMLTEDLVHYVDLHHELNSPHEGFTEYLN